MQTAVRSHYLLKAIFLAPRQALKPSSARLLKHILSFVEILQVKYLNNLIEQDHRFIKKITKLMMGFKAFHSATTIEGIETAHTIQKGQLSDENIPAYKQFMVLAG